MRRSADIRISQESHERLPVGIRPRTERENDIPVSRCALQRMRGHENSGPRKNRLIRKQVPETISHLDNAAIRKHARLEKERLGNPGNGKGLAEIRRNEKIRSACKRDAIRIPKPSHSLLESRMPVRSANPAEKILTNRPPEKGGAKRKRHLKLRRAQTPEEINQFCIAQHDSRTFHCGAAQASSGTMPDPALPQN